jgi:hypothetical protein
MFKPDDFARGRWRLQGRASAAISATLLAVVGIGATAAVTSGVIAPQDPPPAASAASNIRATGAYQLRCWQYGRLLFDEGPVTLAAESRQASRLVAYDRHGATLIVTDTGGTTCLARPFAAAPNLALPR